MYPKEYFKTLFNLNRDMGQIYFREFENSYEFPDSLNPTHIKTMMFLKFNGPSPMSSVSKQLSLEKGSFTSVANRLINSGYVVKQRTEEDKRVFLLKLTDQGEHFSNEFGEQHLEYVKKVIGILDESEQTRYLDMIEELLKMNRKLRVALDISYLCT